MFALSAACTGLLNAVGSISVVAIPFALALTALLIELTMSDTLLVDEPVQVYEQPRSLQASAAPFWVGVKKTLVVTWLTITKWYFSLTPKIAAAELPEEPLARPGLLEPPQASSAAAASPAAAPVRAVRRVS